MRKINHGGNQTPFSQKTSANNMISKINSGLCKQNTHLSPQFHINKSQGRLEAAKEKIDPLRFELLFSNHQKSPELYSVRSPTHYAKHEHRSYLKFSGRHQSSPFGGT